MDVPHIQGVDESNGMKENIVSPQEATMDRCPWYAVRLFSLKHKSIIDYIKQSGLDYFIPMELSFIGKGKSEPKPALHPVVFNLVFIKKNKDEKQIRQIIAESPYKMSVIRKEKEGQAYYEIPYKQMLEFMLMCSPEFEMKKYVSEADAKLKVGTPVYVKYGSLKGLSGKLVRQSKKYFLLKEVPGMAVMIKISRWCCVPMNEGKYDKTVSLG